MSFLEKFVIFSEYLLVFFIFFVVFAGISKHRKEKKKKVRFINYLENKSTNEPQKITSTQKVTSKKIIDDDDPWASFGDPWDDLDKKEEKRNA